MPIDNKILQRLERNDPTLTSLDLVFKNLTDADIAALAKALAKNSVLTALDLGYNQVGDAGVKALSEALAKNSTLTRLDLYYNQVGAAGAKALSEGLTKNSTLTALYLSGNQVGDAGAKVLSEGLAKNSTLTTLILIANEAGLFSRNITETTQEKINQKLTQNKALAEKKKKSKSSAGPSLRVVTLPNENKNTPIQPKPSSSSSDVKDSVSPSFSSDVKANPIPLLIDNEILQRLERNDPTLTKLDLSNKKLTDAAIALLAKALAKNATLTELNLEGNQVGDAGTKALSEALTKNATLTTLALGNNQIGDAGAQALSEALAKNSTLRTLLLGNNQIGDAGAKALSEGLARNAILATLDLGFNQVGTSGAKALSKALAKNATLTALNLGANEVGDTGVRTLSEALAKNAVLTTLNLGLNEFSEAGAKALSEALAKNATLTTLVLDHNQVGDVGAKALSKVLAKNATLTTLNLNSNLVGDSGAKALSEALPNNSTLTRLDLGFNGFGEAGLNALSKALAKNATLTTLDLRLDCVKVGAAGLAFLEPIEQKLAQNEALAEKRKESKSSTAPSSSVVVSRKENKNTSLQPMPSSGSRDVKDAVVLPSFSSEVKANQVSPSLPPLAPTSPVDNKTTSALDAKTLDKLFKLAEQQEAQLLQPPAREASQESMDALQKKLSSIEGTMQHLDGEALTVLQGKAQEVRTLIDQATEQRLAEAERNHIESDDCLCDYYYVLRSQLLHMWLACQVINSEMVDNDKKTKLDYLAGNIDKIAGRFPGLSLLTGFIKAIASGWSYREKKEAMQHMAGFCLGLVEGDTLIDTLARQLTLSQEATLQAKLAPAKTGTFRKALAVFKKAKNWALVNDIDNATKEFAAKQTSQILEAVMKGKIKTPCRSKDVPQLFALVMGANAVYQSPIALPSTTNSFNPNAARNIANVSISVQQTQSYSRMQATLNVVPNASTKDEIAELKQWKAEQEKRAQEQEEKMRTMQEELSQVKNQNQTKEPTVQKRDFESLQAEFSRLKTESLRNGSQVQKQDFDNLQRQLKKLQEGLEQAGITSGGNQLQMSSTAFSTGTVTSEQRQIAELQQQVRLLTARVLTSQEQQSPQDEVEDPARLKLVL